MVEEKDIAHGARLTAAALKVHLDVFRRLERMRGENEFQSVPTFTVRLEALGDDARMMDERAFKIKVSGVAGWAISRDDWMTVLQIAHEHDLEVRLDNGAMVLE